VPTAANPSAALCGAIIFACTAQGQHCGWTVEATPIVSPANPEAEIRVYAWFDYIPDAAELFHTGDFHLYSSDPAFTRFGLPGGIEGSDPRWLPVFPTAIENLRVSQFHIPPGIPGNPANPILVLHAWWQASDFRPRYVTINVVPRPIRPFYVFRSVSSPASVAYPAPPLGSEFHIRVQGLCAADCETSTGVNTLDIFDFLCFQNEFAAGASYACDCDTTTGIRVCDIFDFLCFQDAFAAGCP
jgi:hypothetical protein